jgi:hypothetical protein
MSLALYAHAKVTVHFLSSYADFWDNKKTKRLSNERTQIG